MQYIPAHWKAKSSVSGAELGKDISSYKDYLDALALALRKYIDARLEKGDSGRRATLVIKKTMGHRTF